jgi:hypothetical protein
MATAEKTPPTKPLLPPDERFWKRYSPHHEFPLASTTSVFLHGLVIGILAVGGVAFFLHDNDDGTGPVRSDVVSPADPSVFGGPEGAPAGEPGLPGDKLTEMPGGPPGAPDLGPVPDGSSSELPEIASIPSASLDPLPSESIFDTPDNLSTKFDALGKKLDPAKSPGAAPSSKKPGSGGTGNPTGRDGKNGPGGSGTGTKRPGPGGDGRPGHRKATEQEIKAARWRFELAGSPKEHADKLDKSGVIVAVPDPKARNLDIKTVPLLLITDMKRRPVTLKAGALEDYRDSVKWSNREPASIRGLAQELQLGFEPAYIVLLLPKDRELKMADLERRFAESRGVNVAFVQETVFEFQQVNGVYEPHVTRQK